MIEYLTEESQRINPWSLSALLEAKPISANKMFYRNKRRTKEYNSYAKKWKEALEFASLPEDIKDHKKMAFKIEVNVGLSSPLADLDNCLKSLLDCIQDNLEGFNDKQVIEINATRYVASKGFEWVDFTLTQTFRGQDQ